MSDKLSMSLDEIVNASRAEKKGQGDKKGRPEKKVQGDKKEQAGGKAQKQEKKSREKKPYDKAERKPKPERPEAPPSKSVYVGNLPFTIESPAVETHMSSAGACTVDLATRGAAKKPAGFAIVTFEDIETATKAVETLGDTELEGRKLLIRFAREKPTKDEEKTEEKTEEK
mmetsp:Transcript_17403/g.44558  ORF Transcript_17403/g.44558 Transcript_17403/m.44558 type:complete len:171 (-) Transcript_17403:280-792(-)